MRPIYECPENFRESMTMPWLFFAKFLTGFSSDWCYEYAYKIWSGAVSPWIHPCSLSPKFLWAFVRMDPVDPEEAIQGQWWYRLKERWRVLVGPPSSTLNTCFRDRFCAPAHLFFPNPPLVSPKFPPCSAVSKWMVFGLQREKVLV